MNQRIYYLCSRSWEGGFLYKFLAKYFRFLTLYLSSNNNTINFKCNAANNLLENIIVYNCKISCLLAKQIVNYTAGHTHRFGGVSLWKGEGTMTLASQRPLLAALLSRSIHPVIDFTFALSIHFSFSSSILIVLLHTPTCALSSLMSSVTLFLPLSAY